MTGFETEGPDTDANYTRIHAVVSIKLIKFTLERTCFDRSKLDGPNPIKTFNRRSYAQGRSASPIGFWQLKSGRGVVHPPTSSSDQGVCGGGRADWNWSLIWRWSVHCWSVCCVRGRIFSIRRRKTLN